MKHYWHFLHAQWPLIAFGFATVFWGNLGQSFFLAWYGASIQQTLHLSAANYGLVYALATLASGLLIMAAGGLIDRWPLQRFSLMVAAGLCAGCLMMAGSQSLLGLALAIFLLRLCGQGLMPHTAQTTMARFFSSHRGKAVSFSASGVPVGEVILPILAVWLILLVGWQQSWLLFALSIPLLYIPLNIWLLRQAGHSGQLQRPDTLQSSLNHSSRRHLLKDWRFWCVLPSVLAGPFLLTGVFIQQNYILEAKGWSSAWLATSFIGYGIMHWLSAMVVGSLIDRFTARALVPWVMLPMFLALLSLSILQGQWLAPCFMLLFGIAIGSAHPIFTSLWAEVYGTTHLGAIRALVASMMIFATAAAPWLFGLWIDAGFSAEILFASCAVAAVLAAVLASIAFPFYTSNKDT